jgi:hypothetical protein
VSLTVTHDVAYWKSHYHAKLISTSSIHLAGGYVGKVLVFRGSDNGEKITFRHIIVARRSVAYFLDLWGDPFTEAADAATFKRMYSSWRPT